MLKICLDTINIYEKDMRNSILILSDLQHIEFNEFLMVSCYMFDILFNFFFRISLYT